MAGTLSQSRDCSHSRDYQESGMNSFKIVCIFGYRTSKTATMVFEVVHMRRRRILVLAAGILLMLFILLGRLMQIQLFQAEDFSKHHVNLLKESVKQRTQEILIDDGRGQFLDEAGEPLSYEEKTVLVLFPFLKDIDWKSDELADILHISKTELDNQIEQAKSPYIYGELLQTQAEKISTLNIPGVYAIKKKYIPNHYPAGQLIGVTGENSEEFQKRYPDKKRKDSLKIGVTGLQRSFDEFLLPENPTRLIYHVDALGGPLFGIDVKYTGQSNPFFPLKVKTTINRHFQDGIEALLDKHHIERGGAILLDIETSSILAVASRPSMNQEDPFLDDGTINMMFEQHIPGSVFKTVVAAAAIEEGLIEKDETFDCSMNIHGKPDPRDLGILDFEQSFARSCNKTFGELALRLQNKDPGLLEKYAIKLGLLGPNSWEGDVFYIEKFKQFSQAKGRIFLEESSRTDKNFVAITGIGQHEVRVSPINVANMMATIAKGGEKNTIRAATEIQYGNGAAMYHFPNQAIKGEQLSKYTAIRMQQLLKKVVTDEEGTGTFFRELPYDIAGKSGTAETGVEKDGKMLHHKWFAGYFPFQEPKYSLVVLNLDVPADEGGANPLFADIVQLIKNEKDIVRSLPILP